LRVLDLSLNRIEKLNEKVFWNLENLEKLYLYNSQIEEVPENLFQYNRKMKMLDMHTNKIKTLPFGFLHSLAELESFSISANELEVIQSNTFQQNKKLKWLRLYSNKIEAFGLGTFDGLKKLFLLDLTRNRCIDKQYGDRFSKVPIDLRRVSSDLTVCAKNHGIFLQDLMKKLKNNFNF
jgi:Leucine-rich repeat (LRR) protein